MKTLSLTDNNAKLHTHRNILHS